MFASIDATSAAIAPFLIVTLLSLRIWKPSVLVPVEPTSAPSIVYVNPPRSIVTSLSITIPSPDASARRTTSPPTATASASVSYSTPFAVATGVNSTTPNVPSPLSAGTNPSAQYVSSTACVNVPPLTAIACSFVLYVYIPPLNVPPVTVTFSAPLPL